MVVHLVPLPQPRLVIVDHISFRIVVILCTTLYSQDIDVGPYNDLFDVHECDSNGNTWIFLAIRKARRVMEAIRSSGHLLV